MTTSTCEGTPVSSGVPLHELSWMAGIIEGEGSFCANGRRTNGQPRRSLRVRVAMTDEDIIKRLQAIVPTGDNPEGFLRTIPGEPRSRYWTWEVTGDRARWLAGLLYPYMGERRRARIEELIA